MAEKLKNGMEVPAETFEAATLFFSDIVGFTHLCSESSPIEIVSMLNELYSFFDAAIAQHDAYKVGETVYFLSSPLAPYSSNKVRDVGVPSAMPLTFGFNKCSQCFTVDPR